MYTSACVTGTFLSAPLGLSGMGTGCVLCMFANASVMKVIEMIIEADHCEKERKQNASKENHKNNKDDLDEDLDGDSQDEDDINGL